MRVSRTQIMIAAIALTVAGTSGYFLEDGAPLQVPTRIVALSAALDGAAVPVDRGVPPLPALAPRRLAADAPLPVLPESAAPEGCAPAVLALSPLPGAMIGVAVEAPCRAGERVEIFHAGLGFAVRLSDQAAWQGSVPALAEDAAIALRFEAGDELLGRMRVPDLPGLVRVGVEWRGTAPLELHAYENGAAFGGPGHVHAGAPAGRMMVLGDDVLARPMRAQVYTAPAGGEVALEIAAEIGPEGCGKPLEAQVFRAGNRAPTVLAAVSLALPGCDGAGGYVVMPLPGIAAQRLALSN